MLSERVPYTVIRPLHRVDPERRRRYLVQQANNSTIDNKPEDRSK